MTYIWKNERNDGGRIEVGEKGALDIHVEDDHYSGTLDWERALRLASNIFSMYLDSQKPMELASEDQKKALRAILESRPVEFPVFAPDGSQWVIRNERVLETLNTLRDLTVNSIARLGLSPMSALPVLLELSVQVGDKLTRERFLQNAEFWYDAVALATPDAPALQSGGSA